jgi:chromosomal replication initiation ATPase DnaA
MDIKEKKALAETLVSNFTTKFQEAIGTKPIVKYSIDSNAPTINEVYNVVNDHFKIVMNNDEVSICDNIKKPEYVKYRNIYFSICRDFEYSLTSIGKVVKKDHATVLYGSKKITETSELKKELKSKLYNQN